MKLLDKDGLTYSTSKIKNELTDYVKNTDYATSSKGGVIKASIGQQLVVNSSGELTSRVVAYSSYGNILENAFISKGTLDNVLTAKIGDIQTLLDNLNNGGGVE